jgi:tripartite ATP-independent transporter DctP family solute receptor
MSRCRGEGRSASIIGFGRRSSRWLGPLALGCLALLQGCARVDADQPRNIVLAHAMHVTHPVAVAMAFMAERVEELSAGQIRVTIYPGSQLGGERELLELVQMGAVGLTKVSGAALENIVPPIRVFSLPYLFRDDEHMRSVTDGPLGEELLASGEPYLLKGLAYYDAGWRSFYTVARPILHPQDLAGLKIRVQPSVMAMTLVRHLGGSPTPLAYGELYTAFQGGLVDGAENNPPSFFTSRHYEVTRYYVLNEHTAVPDFLIIGTPLWNQLSEQERSWLREAVQESVVHQRELWRESEEESLREVEAAGVQVIHPDKEPFRQQVQTIYEQIRRTDPALYRWVERIRQAEEAD